MNLFLPVKTKFYIACTRCNTKHELFAPGCDIRAEKEQFMEHLQSIGWESYGHGDTLAVCPGCAKRNPS